MIGHLDSSIFLPNSIPFGLTTDAPKVPIKDVPGKISIHSYKIAGDPNDEQHSCPSAAYTKSMTKAREIIQSNPNITHKQTAIGQQFNRNLNDNEHKRSSKRPKDLRSTKDSPSHQVFRSVHIFIDNPWALELAAFQLRTRDATMAWMVSRGRKGACWQ